MPFVFKLMPAHILSSGLGTYFYNIIQQRVNALAEGVGAHRYGNDRAINNVSTQRCTNFGFGESLAAKIALHERFARFCNRFHQRLSADLKIRSVVIRDFAGNNLLALPAVTGFGYDVDIASRSARFHESAG